MRLSICIAGLGVIGLLIGVVGCGKSAETAESFVGSWMAADGMIQMEFRLGKWDEKHEKDPEGDGMALLIVWAGEPDEEGRRPVQSAGFVVWEKTDEGIKFEGAVGKGTGVLLDKGKALSLSWESDMLVGPFYPRQKEEHQALLKRQ